MKNKFEIAAGTIIGRDHVTTKKNNQDAHLFYADDELILAIAADGCSEGNHSEVGAKIGVKIIAKAIMDNLKKFPQPEAIDASERFIQPFSFWEGVRFQVLEEIKALAIAMGGSFSRTVVDYFLFTIVGAMMTPSGASIFSIGDGVAVVNGEVINLGPFPKNEPPYLSYGLTGSSVTDSNPETLNFKISRILAVDEVNNILVGTDGLNYLINASQKNMPGGSELVGHLSQFWENDKYFKNPDNIRRKLTLINRDVEKFDLNEKRMIKENGLLPDDTTLAVIRRKID